MLFFLSVLLFEQQRLRLALPVAYFLMLVVLISRLAHHTAHHAHQPPPQADDSGDYLRRRPIRPPQLLEAIKQVSEYNAVAFVDDNTAIQRMVIYDLPVHKPEIGNLINRYGVEKILLAIPSASTEVRKNIIHQLEAYPL